MLDYETDTKDYIRSRMDDLTIEQLEVILVITNLLWQDSMERPTGAVLSREWDLDRVSIKVRYNE